jgi:hypothetical protein
MPNRAFYCNHVSFGRELRCFNNFWHPLSPNSSKTNNMYSLDHSSFQIEDLFVLLIALVCLSSASLRFDMLYVKGKKLLPEELVVFWDSRFQIKNCGAKSGIWNLKSGIHRIHARPCRLRNP